MRGFVMDHDPPLELRAWNEETQDTIPPANDPDHLFGLTPSCNKRKTYGPRGPHTAIDSDRHAIDKNKRLRGETGRTAPKRRWGSRKMGKRGTFAPTPVKRLENL